MEDAYFHQNWAIVRLCVCISPRKVFSSTLVCLLIMVIVGDGDANVDAGWLLVYSLLLRLFSFRRHCPVLLCIMSIFFGNEIFLPFFWYLTNQFSWLVHILKEQ